MTDLINRLRSGAVMPGDLDAAAEQMQAQTEANAALRASVAALTAGRDALALSLWEAGAALDVIATRLKEGIGIDADEVQRAADIAKASSRAGALVKGVEG